jgi:hypothetical protein
VLNNDAATTLKNIACETESSMLCKVLLCMSAEDQPWGASSHTRVGQKRTRKQAVHWPLSSEQYLYAVIGATGAASIIEIQRKVQQGLTVPDSLRQALGCPGAL